jgi:photosystem II stability/assembly factor-like uncharacterized protein
VGGTSGGNGLHGPAVGEAVSDGDRLAHLSCLLHANGTIELAIHGSPTVTAQAQLSKDGIFTMAATVAGAAVSISGQVEAQPGMKNKFVVTGTWTGAGMTGTLALRSLDWEVLDGLAPAWSELGIEVSSTGPQMAFLDANHGFVAFGGVSGDPSMPVQTTRLWRTTDAGKTWTAAGAIPGQVTALAALGPTLWAASNAGLFSSNDQGGSFTRQLGLDGLSTSGLWYKLKLDFLDAQHGVVLSPELRRAWVTQDGGRSWKASAALLDTQSLSMDTLIPSAQMLSPTAAVVSLPASTNGRSALQHFRTVDAGATWVKVVPSAASLGSYSAIQFVDANAGWAWSGDSKTLATTEDGGATWVPTSGRVTFPSQWSTSTSAHDALAVVDANTAWIAKSFDNSYHVSVTSDHGQTFLGGRLDCVPWSFWAVSATRAVVNCAPGVTYLTSDSGTSFQVVPIEQGEISALRVGPDGTGSMLIASAVYTTQDRGATWARAAATSIPTAGSPSVLLSTGEYWIWTPVGLHRVSPAQQTSALVALIAEPAALQTTRTSLWARTSTGWVVLPADLGVASHVDAGRAFWPLTDQSLIAVIEPTFSPDVPTGSASGLQGSSDGGRSWTRLAGTATEAGGIWNGCVADATHAWFERNGTFYRYTEGVVETALVTRGATGVSRPIYCDNTQWWFVDGVPTVLAGTSLTTQTLPLEWRSAKASSPRPLLPEANVVASGAAGASAIWLLLSDGRVLRYLDDDAYGRYLGAAVLGTAPAPSTPSTPTAGAENRAPTLEPIQGEAHYNYDVDGNYLGGTLSLVAIASDPDGDAVTLSWTVRVTSGSATLASTTGTSNLLVFDSFASGTVVVSARDSKGASTSQSFAFSRP